LQITYVTLSIACRGTKFNFYINYNRALSFTVFEKSLFRSHLVFQASSIQVFDLGPGYPSSHLRGPTPH